MITMKNKGKVVLMRVVVV